MTVSLISLRNGQDRCTNRMVDAIGATTFHQSGTILATASGQQHHPIGLEGLSGGDESHEESLSRRRRKPRSEICDNSLKIWTL